MSNVLPVWSRGVVPPIPNFHRRRPAHLRPHFPLTRRRRRRPRPSCDPSIQKTNPAAVEGEKTGPSSHCHSTGNCCSRRKGKGEKSRSRPTHLRLTERATESELTPLISRRVCQLTKAEVSPFLSVTRTVSITNSGVARKRTCHLNTFIRIIGSSLYILRRPKSFPINDEICSTSIQ